MLSPHGVRIKSPCPIADIDGGFRNFDCAVFAPTEIGEVVDLSECRDRSGKNDKMWLDEVEGKVNDVRLAGISVRKVHLVHRLALTSQALKKAKRLGYETRVLPRLRGQRLIPIVGFGHLQQSWAPFRIRVAFFDRSDVPPEKNMLETVGEDFKRECLYIQGHNKLFSVRTLLDELLLKQIPIKVEGPEESEETRILEASAPGMLHFQTYPDKPLKFIEVTLKVFRDQSMFDLNQSGSYTSCAGELSDLVDQYLLDTSSSMISAAGVHAVESDGVTHSYTIALSEPLGAVIEATRSKFHARIENSTGTSEPEGDG